MALLSVNLNKVALLRNTRTIGIPSVTHAANIALAAGADGITVHPRPDERHIRLSDVDELSVLLKGRPNIEFNIEGNPFHGLMECVRKCRPHQCTLVPDAMDQSTSDHGWNLPSDSEMLRPIVNELTALGIRVSLFMDPESSAMKEAAALGVERVELYTESYARAFGGPDEKAVLQRFVDAAQAANDAGIGVNAGHDLNLANLPLFISAVPHVTEVSIGHALIADALEFGLAETVRRYRVAALGRT